MQWALRATLCSLSHHAVWSVVCCQDSTLKPLVISLYVILCAIICFEGSSCCKHDVGALSWLNAETVERAPTPHFGRLVKCSTHGPFFTRLWYMPDQLCQCLSLVLPQHITLTFTSQFWVGDQKGFSSFVSITNPTLTFIHRCFQWLLSWLHRSLLMKNTK